MKTIVLLLKRPNLRDAKSDAKTYVEALQNVETIILEWIETAKPLGRNIPEPKCKLMYA